jgi:hypothetical protein
MEQEILFSLRTSLYGPILQKLWSLKGVVFGGFLRDVIANDEPNDMDVCLLWSKYKDFTDYLTSSGYQNQKHLSIEDQEVWTKADSITLEILLLEDEEAKDCLLGPCCDPDFDVNLLTTDGEKFWPWVGLEEWTLDDGDIDIRPPAIIRRICQRQTFPLAPAEDRVKKFNRKGYSWLSSILPQ